MLTTLLTLAAAVSTPVPAAAPADLAAIEATCFDYVDGQLQGDPERVKRALHPDLAKRRVLGDTADERLGLQRMSREELVDLTKRGALKTPENEWNRSCRILDVAGNAAAVRVETPWFVDYFHMGKFGERWVIVNALWHMKPRAAPDGAAQPAATLPAAPPLFALALAPGPAWKPGRPFAEQGLRPHFDYWMALFRQGRIASAGPVGSDGGLVLLRAADQAAADAILAADPAVAARIFTGTVRPYAPPMVNAGLLKPPAPTPDPRRPAPTLDSVAPTLPVLTRPAVLIVSKTNGYRHDSIAQAVPAIEALVKGRGWSSFATENAAVFNPDQLAKFDVIVFASASGDIYTPDQRAAFQGWIAKGGGFVGIHSAGDGSHPAWFVKMRGNGQFIGHPGGADQFQAGDLILIDRTHPATRALPERWRWTDEYYSWDAPPAADAHILARLGESSLRLDPKFRMGDGHALIWWRCEGRARIFYSALGHRAEAWADPAHLKMLDGAIGWAARKEGTGCDGTE